MPSLKTKGILASDALNCEGSASKFCIGDAVGTGSGDLPPKTVLPPIFHSCRTDLPKKKVPALLVKRKRQSNCIFVSVRRIPMIMIRRPGV